MTRMLLAISKVSKRVYTRCAEGCDRLMTACFDLNNIATLGLAPTVTPSGSRRVFTSGRGFQRIRARDSSSWTRRSQSARHADSGDCQTFEPLRWATAGWSTVSCSSVT